VELPALVHLESRFYRIIANNQQMVLNNIATMLQILYITAQFADGLHCQVNFGRINGFKKLPYT